TRIALVAACCLALLGAAMFAPAQDAEAKAKYQEAITYLTKIESELDPEVRTYVPALKAALERYYLNKAELLLSEKQLVETFLEEMKDPANAPRTGTLVSRGRGDKLPKLSALLKSKTAAPPAAKPEPPKAQPPVKNPPTKNPPTKKPPTKSPPAKPAAKPVTKPAVKAPNFKLPGVTTRPVFSSTVRTVAGKRIGVVSVSIENRRQTLVEIMSDSGGFTIAKRADLIADRLRDLHKKDALWWMHLSSGRANNQVIVKAPKAPDGTLVTADPAWASECGVSPEQLAKMLVSNIRNAFDDRPGSLIHRGDPTPEELRTMSVRLRMSGDEQYQSNPAEAEQKYRQAIAADPSHLAPHLRLADLLIQQGRKDDARQVLQSALEAPLKDDEKAQVQRKLDSL
ncbi:MAG TPA: tetratricopeptide repeat protein, partial [Fimbriimonadaceae bacterium]|nr:tetratricopeptide repeat protein [Fimbriimonadaceae bacterium]